MTRLRLDRFDGYEPRRIEGSGEPAAVLVPLVGFPDVGSATGEESATSASEESTAAVDGSTTVEALDPDGLGLLITRRAPDLDVHPGQVSFPGGRAEPTDENPLYTATREAREEVRLDPDELTVVGRLDDIRTVTGYVVTPFVGGVPRRRFVPDGREIVEVGVLPLSAFLEPSNYEFERRSHPEYGEAIVHYFHVGDFTVWGATARILVQFLELATDWSSPAPDEPELIR